MAAIGRVVLRYGLLFAARALGRLRHVVLGTWWRPLIFLIVASMALRLVVDRASGLEPGSLLDDEWLRPERVIVVLGLLGLLRWVLNARKRLVIGTFVDYTDDEPKALPGLSTLLQVQLARLYGLVDTVDQSRAVPEVLKGPQSVSFDEQLTLEEADDDPTIITYQPLLSPAPLTAEDLTEVLDAAVSVEATMNLGPVKIPIGVLAGLVGRLAQGPRLSGSVHRTEDAIVLTARTVGATPARTWRVDRPVAPGGPEPRAEELLDELTVRIFTDLALEGSVKWQATWAYLNGLRAYRNCLRTKKDRRISLERAKDHFIETIVEDEQFDLAHYNLGVVATELNQPEAAEAAFLAAIRLNKDRWGPYYALAQLYFAQGRCDEALPLCGRIIRMQQHRAEAYHLRALSQRRNHDLPAAMRDRRAAVFWSWVRLCRAAVRGQEAEARQLAATSLRNLGCMRAYEAKGRWPPVDDPDDEDQEKRPLRLRIGYLGAAMEMRQGRFVNRSDAEMHFELGKLYAARRKWRAAARQVERAVEIVPDRPRFWIQLARAYAGPRSTRRAEALRERAVFASSRASARPSLIADGGFERLITVYRRLGRGKDAVRMRKLLRFEQQRRTWGPDTPPSTELERLLAELGRKPLWEVTQLCVQLAERYLDLSDEEQASRVADRLAEQLDELSRFHPREVRDYQVHALLAEALHVAGRDAEALRHAEAAVVYDPLSCRARRVLATLYFSLGHFEQATEAWRAALVCEPDGAATNLSMGECLVHQALAATELDRRTSMLEEGCRHLRNALKLHELGGAGGRNNGAGPPEPEQMEGRARYWLGRAHFELDDYEQAVTQLQLCTSLGYEPLLARLHIGLAYLRSGKLSEGERALVEIRDLARKAASSDTDGAAAGVPGEVSASDALAWAELYVAASHIERDAGVEDAVQVIRRVADEARARDGEPPPGLLAACADWEGWARFLLGDHEGAITDLHRSIRLEPTPEGYLHLALVYANHALERRTPGERERDASRARHYADLAARLGLGARQAKPLDDVLRRLDAETTAIEKDEAGQPAAAVKAGV